MALTSLNIDELQTRYTDLVAAKLTVLTARDATTGGSTEETWCTNAANAIDTAAGLVRRLIAAAKKATLTVQSNDVTAKIAVEQAIIDAP